MGNVFDMLVLLVLGASVAAWMKLSMARERAAREARTLCQRYCLQLLDETVGLRRVRLHRMHGVLRVERCYDFEVSVDGDDRQPGHLWMVGNTVTSTSLPIAEDMPAGGPADRTTTLPATCGNVVILPSPRPGSQARPS